MGLLSKLFSKPQPHAPQQPPVKPNSLAATLLECQKYKCDTFSMFTVPNCEYCSKYGRNRKGKAQVYSISGNSKKYPSMMIIPSDLVIGEPCPICNKYISFGIHIDGINTF